MFNLYNVCVFVFRRERHDIPLIVQTCVDEVEKRGLSEVGVYRVVGVLRDVEELRQSFDSGMYVILTTFYQLISLFSL